MSHEGSASFSHAFHHCPYDLSVKTGIKDSRAAEAGRKRIRSTQRACDDRSCADAELNFSPMERVHSRHVTTRPEVNAASSRLGRSTSAGSRSTRSGSLPWPLRVGYLESSVQPPRP